MIESSSSAMDENLKSEHPASETPNTPPQSEGASPSVTEELQKKVQELEAQVKEKEGKYLYLYADFENYKKRTVKERSDLIKFGWESVARDLLQTMDNLERALTHTPAETDRNLVHGLNMVLEEFKSTLKRQGVLEIQSIHQNFDPHFHEAVGQEAHSAPAGTIIKEHLRGYTLHGRLLRASRVILSSGQS